MRFNIDQLWAHYEAFLKMIQYYNCCAYLSYKPVVPNEGRVVFVLTGDDFLCTYKLSNNQLFTDDFSV
jgi:hypothetical protein